MVLVFTYETAFGQTCHSLRRAAGPGQWHAVHTRVCGDGPMPASIGSPPASLSSAMVAPVQWLHYTVPMPTISRLQNCTITMYAADHQPPHFHVRMRDGREALIVIDTLSVLSGSIKPRELAEALAWAGANIPTLIAKWQELNP